MKSIKFSHNYHKLPETWEGSLAVLMAVVPQKMGAWKQQSPAFIDYDTTYKDKAGIENKYPLDFADGLILFFIHLKTGKPFTTIRRDWPAKREYYQGAVGETFCLERYPE